MRESFRNQPYLFETPIPDLEIPKGNRHPLYAAINALQWIYPHRKDICDSLTNDLCRGQSTYRGAPGMSGWQVLVLGVIRMIHERNFDEIALFFNEMPLMRKLLELHEEDDFLFSPKTLQDNWGRISSESIENINRRIIDLAVANGMEDGKVVRADSFACKRPIHYPTDQSVVYDAARKLIEACHKTFGACNGWRQAEHNKKKAKRLQHKVSQSKRGGGKGKATRVKSAYRRQLQHARGLLEKVEESLHTLDEQGAIDSIDTDAFEGYNEIVWWYSWLQRVTGLAWRRTQLGEEIENYDKILSIFEPETELINRGKFPNPIEFGHRVALAQGLSGLIVDYSVMGKGQTDRHELIPLLKRLSSRFGKLNSFTADKGYWFKECIEESSQFVEQAVLPKKGKRNKEESDREHSDSFIEMRRWRSGVESVISCSVRINGLGLCRDKGMEGYRRWVGTGVLARNLITLGRILLEQDRHRDAA